MRQYFFFLPSFCLAIFSAKIFGFKMGVYSLSRCLIIRLLLIFSNNQRISCKKKKSIHTIIICMDCLVLHSCPAKLGFISIVRCYFVATGISVSVKLIVYVNTEKENMASIKKGCRKKCCCCTVNITANFFSPSSAGN